MPFSVAFMRKLDIADAGLKDILWSLLEEIERDREESVTKQEFLKLSEIVANLGETTLEIAEVQKRTEQRMEELTEAQKCTEQRVEELTEAQKRTEQELHQLVHEHKETRRQVGGLAMTVGYGLEDKAYPALPNLLHRDFGIVVRERLVRRFVKDKKGNDIEVNIFGKAVMNDKDIMIIGESKSQLSENDIRNFLRKKVKHLENVFDNLFPVLVTYMITGTDVENFAKDQGIALYYSYDFYQQNQ